MFPNVQLGMVENVTNQYSGIKMSLHCHVRSLEFRKVTCISHPSSLETCKDT